jgi:hypothetical protein
VTALEWGITRAVVYWWQLRPQLDHGHVLERIHFIGIVAAGLNISLIGSEVGIDSLKHQLACAGV